MQVMRVPKGIIKSIKRLSKAQGWPVTDLVITIMDQAVRMNIPVKKTTEQKELVAWRFPEHLWKEIRRKSKEAKVDVVPYVYSCLRRYIEYKKAGR